MTSKVRGHLGMGEEFLVFTFDILTEIRVVWRIMAYSIRCVFGFEVLKTE
jgi:hypothetical protein